MTSQILLFKALFELLSDVIVDRIDALQGITVGVGGSLSVVMGRLHLANADAVLAYLEVLNNIELVV